MLGIDVACIHVLGADDVIFIKPYKLLEGLKELL